MPRHRQFRQGAEPVQDHESPLQLKHDTVTGPVSFLNPTHAQYSHSSGSDEVQASAGYQAVKPSSQEGLDGSSPVHFHWTSRNNRKGRHAVIIAQTDPQHGPIDAPPASNSSATVLHTIGRMFIAYPIWDISWIVAYIFTWGSIVWVFNAFFVFLPLLRPSTEFSDEISVGGGVTAFIGATIFEIGSVFLMIEAVNENKDACFGFAVEDAFDNAIEHKQPGRVRVTPAGHTCKHHHRNRKNLVGKATSASDRARGDGAKSWVWFPSWHDLRHHYLHELGFLACSSQMLGATIFWIAGFTALPGIYENLSPAALNWAYWFPQVLGGSGFVISGTLFMLETQKHWWQPAPGVLGWHIGLWNLIGGLGFTLCPAFGFDTADWAQFQASCSTFWGSFAFLIGSVVQLYESLQKYSVQVKKK